MAGREHADMAGTAARIADHARYWKQAGVRAVAVPESAPRAESMQGAERQSESSSEANPNDAAETLRVLAAEVAGCTRCPLAGGRTHTVFGVGDPNADVVFVGEGPGRDEDLKGEPFVGRAGQLLTDIIERGMGVPRASVYICNTVKCRPPENRNPFPTELAACEPYLVAQLAAIRPKVIVALGKFAAQSLCRTETPISRLRGQWQEYEGIPVMPTYHPAYLLRNPSSKREVWEDIQAVMARVGLQVNLHDRGARS
jgi:uracil-DNA glycosylase family 4